MGTTKASLQSCGISPSFRDNWNNTASAGANSSAAVFRMKTGISSGPVALCIFRFFNNLWMPFESTLMSCIVGAVLSPMLGMLERSSWVNTDLNCSFRMLRRMLKNNVDFHCSVNMF